MSFVRLVHIICGTIVSSIIIYVNEEFSQRRLPLSPPPANSLSLSLSVSQVANGQLNCLFSAIRTFKYFKSRGQLCNFLDCATKPNDKFNAPLDLGPAEQRCGNPSLLLPCPCHMLKTNKNTLRRRWSAALPACVCLILKRSGKRRGSSSCRWKWSWSWKFSCSCLGVLGSRWGLHVDPISSAELAFLKLLKNIKAEKLLLREGDRTEARTHYSLIKIISFNSLRIRDEQRVKKRNYIFLFFSIFTSCYKELLTKILDHFVRCLCINNAERRRPEKRE